MADKFYKQFRCGILHQAETGGSSKVSSVGPMLWVNGDAITVKPQQVPRLPQKGISDLSRRITRSEKLNAAQQFSEEKKKMDFISRL
jgi:hypothetical protein